MVVVVLVGKVLPPQVNLTLCGDWDLGGMWVWGMWAKGGVELVHRERATVFGVPQVLSTLTFVLFSYWCQGLQSLHWW